MYNDDKELIREYPYLFSDKYKNASPHSFEGIMKEIQHSLFYGRGISRENLGYSDLKKRIDRLSGYNKNEALAELRKAEELFERDQNRMRQEYDQKYEKEEAERKEKAIAEYKQEWRKKGFFYKITHRKKKPSKVDFDSMNSVQINQEKSGLRR